MRLLQVYTRQLEEFNGQSVPPYAILSHTWGKREITFQDISNPDHTSYEGYTKIDGCCRQAAKDGLDYVWIDTCCIDKSSSAELSEGINSMFQWYKNSRVCYVYLSDVTADDDPFTDDSEFRNSRWFTRGWTLQEILAPMELLFFNMFWNEIPVGRINRSLSNSLEDKLQLAFHQELYANRIGLLYLLSEITNIPKVALDTGDFSEFCAAARFAWAADRETTRLEDRAYSLLGLLEVNMPLLYGEGDKAFIRLQEEVIKSRDDDSLLAWGYCLTPKSQSKHQPDTVLAQSPFDFKHCHSFQKLETEETSPDIPLTTAHSAMTNIGMQMAIPLRPIDSKNKVFIAILRCIVPGTFDHRNHLVVPLVRTKGGDKNHYSRAPGSSPFLVRREKLFSMINSSKFLFILSRVPSVWKLFITKPISTPIYLRVNSPMPPPPLSWPKSRRRECESMSLYIDEVISAGYEVTSFYPPWITKRLSLSNCLDLRLGSSIPAKFILIFSKPGESESRRTSFAVCISPKSRRISRVDHRSALEFLMEQSRSLEVDMNRTGIRDETLEFGEKNSGGHIKRTYTLWFEYMFGDVRIKCRVKESKASASTDELDPRRPKGESYIINNLAEQESSSSWSTKNMDSPTLK